MTQRTLSEYWAEEDSAREAAIDRYENGDAEKPYQAEPATYQQVEEIGATCPGCGQPWDEQSWRYGSEDPSQAYCLTCDIEQETPRRRA